MKAKNFVKHVTSIMWRQIPSGHMDVIRNVRKVELKLSTNLVCDVIYYNDSVGASVVAGCDCTKPLLTCSIPLSMRTHQLSHTF